MNDNLPEGTEFNLKDAAKKTGYSEQHLRRLCKAGKVPCVQRGANWFFTAEHLARIVIWKEPWIAKRAAAAQPLPEAARLPQVDPLTGKAVE